MRIRKLIAGLALTTILLFGGSSVAEGIDFGSMTNEELTALIESAQNELNSRMDTSEVKVLAGEILNADGYVLSVESVSSMQYEGNLFIIMDVVAENNSEYDIEIDMSFESINDWDVRDTMASEAVLVSSGKKTQKQFTFIAFNMGLTELSDIESFEYELSVWDKGRTLFNLYRTDVIKGRFE